MRTTPQRVDSWVWRVERGIHKMEWNHKWWRAQPGGRKGPQREASTLEDRRGPGGCRDGLRVIPDGG